MKPVLQSVLLLICLLAQSALGRVKEASGTRRPHRDRQATCFKADSGSSWPKMRPAGHCYRTASI